MTPHSLQEYGFLCCLPYTAPGCIHFQRHTVLLAVLLGIFGNCDHSLFSAVECCVCICIMCWKCAVHPSLYFLPILRPQIHVTVILQSSGAGVVLAYTFAGEQQATKSDAYTADAAEGFNFTRVFVRKPGDFANCALHAVWCRSPEAEALLHVCRPWWRTSPDSCGCLAEPGSKSTLSIQHLILAASYCTVPTSAPVAQSLLTGCRHFANGCQPWQCGVIELYRRHWTLSSAGCRHASASHTAEQPARGQHHSS